VIHSGRNEQLRGVRKTRSRLGWTGELPPERLGALIRGRIRVLYVPRIIMRAPYNDV
jgi:hypothetical protein